MKRILVFVMALMTMLAVPVIAEARHGGHHGGGHHGYHGHRGYHGYHGFRGYHGYRGYRGYHRYYGHHGRWYGHRRYWHGRWWAYGVGSCWRWSPYYDRFVWVCY